MDDRGKLSQKPHPAVFGNKLKNPHVTTDYAENQLEFVTGVHSTARSALKELNEIMSWSQQQLEDENLWPLSMPPDIDSEDEIPLARYGNSPEAHSKEIYRRGLATRYGKIIQIVSGVHYNFSCTEEFWDSVLPAGLSDNERIDTINNAYMGVVRNFLRLRWLLVYAYGASPVTGRGYPHNEDLADYCPVSIRMSRYGYSNSEQRGFIASFNSLEEYLQDLQTACSTPHPVYEKIGLYKDGEQIQLNTNILQSPSEYYSPVRLKDNDTGRINRVEFRTLDISPFEVTGVNEQQLDVMFILLLHCLFSDSPLFEKEERDRVNALQRQVALCGRSPNFPIKDACHELMASLSSMAKWLDDLHGCKHYTTSLVDYCDSVKNKTILAERMDSIMTGDNLTHQQYGLRLMQEHTEQLRGQSVSPALEHELKSSL